MDGLTETSHDVVVATIGQTLTTMLHSILHRSLRHLQSTSAHQIGSVLSETRSRISADRAAIVYDDSLAIQIGNSQLALNTLSIGVLTEVQQLETSQIGCNLGVHPSHSENAAVVTHGLLHSLAHSGSAHTVRFRSRRGSLLHSDVGSMQLPLIPVISIVIGNSEDTLQDTEHTSLALLLPILVNLGYDVLHRICTGVEVVHEVLGLPGMCTTVDDTRLIATAGSSQGNVGITIVVVIVTTQNIVERNGIQVGAIGDHVGDLAVLLNCTRGDHSSQGRILSSLPPHKKQLIIKRKIQIFAGHVFIPPFLIIFG
nr:MAG TPA: hypothetical protein [Caudoviricetes sp.]